MQQGSAIRRTSAAVTDEDNGSKTRTRRLRTYTHHKTITSSRHLVVSALSCQEYQSAAAAFRAPEVQSALHLLSSVEDPGHWLWVV